MYCPRCAARHFAGSRCPACGGPMRRDGTKFTLSGEIRPDFMGSGVAEPSMPARRARRSHEPGRSEGVIVRFAYKVMESIFGCALFSVSLRVVIFLVKVIDSLVQTGGDIREGISFSADIGRAVEWYEIAGWALVTVIIFKTRRTPR
ncbi:MAG: hypothetical protein PHN82_03525 [bacterium]|nr:hypothetical protein [bacterium]